MSKHWKDEISVEHDGDGLGFVWFDREQLRQSVKFIAALVRQLEELPDTAAIGLREQIITRDAAAPVIHDLTAMTDDELELIRQRWVQDAAITIDGNSTGYRLATDGVKRGMVSVTIPAARRAAFEQSVEGVITSYAQQHGVPFRCMWLTDAP